MSATAKRTRSQLTVPDGILQLPLSRSPLKDARSTLRNTSRQNTELRLEIDALDMDMEDVVDSEEDEILLSPRKRQKTTTTRSSAKRSSSPLDDIAQVSKFDGGRDRKRPRRDSVLSELTDNLRNIENTPQSGSRPTPTRATTNHRKPVSASTTMEATDRNTNSATHTPRAQSVPLYTTKPLPHIDLMKVPSSPWRSPVKQKLPTALITRLGQIDGPQQISTESEAAEVSQPHVGITMGGIGLPSRTPSEFDAKSTDHIEDVEDLKVDTSASAPSIPAFNSNIKQHQVSFGGIHADAALLTTPRPFNLASWPEMSPLTPLLETPYPHRAHQSPEVSINDIEPDLDGPDEHPTSADQITSGLPPFGTNSTSSVPGGPKPPEGTSELALTNIKAKTSAVTSLAKVLGPRTAAKISAFHSSTRGPSTAFAGSARPTSGLKTVTVASRAPGEKLKARMKMREKPLTAFSFAKTRAPTAGRVTRSLVMKKGRSRSASVDLGDRIHTIGMSGVASDVAVKSHSYFSILDAQLFTASRIGENPVAQKPPDKQPTIAPVAPTSAQPVTNHSKAVAPSDMNTLPRPRTSDFPPIKPVSPSKPMSDVPTKPSTTSKPESTRQTTATAHIRSSVTSPTKASLARAAAIIPPSTMSKPKSSPALAPFRGTSSLANLSNALEKLNVPRPMRPNSNLGPRPSTSMGFNRESSMSENVLEKTKSCAVDDVVIGREKPDMSGLGIGKRGPGLRRAVTLGSESFRGDCDDSLPAEASNSASNSEDGGTGALPSPARGSEVTADVSKSSSHLRLPPRAGQTSLTAWMSGGTSRGPGSHTSGSQTKPRFFVPGLRTAGSLLGTAVSGAGIGRGARKVSRIPGLPSVVGSPVKGQSSASAERPDDDEPSRGTDLISKGNPSPDNGDDEDLETIFIAKTEGTKSSLWSKETFSRASLASQALSQSLDEVRTEIAKGSIGPPPPPSENTEITPGEHSSPVTVPNRALRSSTRISAAIANSKLTNKQTGTEPPSSKPVRESRSNVTLSILKGCTVFVDVRTDDGDDAGALFVQMLRDMGARILTRVGQSCTHIVFKNGLLSTLTRYRLLNEPKPKVVGIAWVVECVEQRQCIDELKFKIELEGMNVAGVNKRRRSMLPKHIPGPCESDEASPSGREPEMAGDVSFSAKVSDDLPPLEKARMRKALLPNGSRFKR